MKLLDKLTCMNIADCAVRFEYTDQFTNEFNHTYKAYHITTLSKMESKKHVRDVLSDYGIQDVDKYRLYVYVRNEFPGDTFDQDITILIKQ